MTLSERIRNILLVVRDKGRVSKSTILFNLRTSREQFNLDFDEVKNLDLIKRVKSSFTFYYEITPRGYEFLVKNGINELEEMKVLLIDVKNRGVVSRNFVLSKAFELNLITNKKDRLVLTEFGEGFLVEVSNES